MHIWRKSRSFCVKWSTVVSILQLITLWRHSSDLRINHLKSGRVAAVPTEWQLALVSAVSPEQNVCTFFTSAFLNGTITQRACSQLLSSVRREGITRGRFCRFHADKPKFGERFTHILQNRFVWRHVFWHLNYSRAKFQPISLEQGPKCDGSRAVLYFSRHLHRITVTFLSFLSSYSPICLAGDLPKPISVR